MCADGAGDIWRWLTGRGAVGEGGQSGCWLVLLGTTQGTKGHLGVQSLQHAGGFLQLCAGHLGAGPRGKGCGYF